MKLENRCTKLYIKSLPAPLALELIDKYKIPSPCREVLITVCVDRKGGYAGVHHLHQKFEISLGYWTFVERLRDALEMFYKTHTYYGYDFSTFLTPKNQPKTPQD